MGGSLSSYLQNRQIPEFFNAWCMVTVALFGLNNHLLKIYYHNWITGKLSDFCACFFLPLLLSAIFSFFSHKSPAARVKAGCLITVGIFCSVKLSPGASDWLNLTLSCLTAPFGIGRSVNIADPTDLIALPAVYAAYLFVTRYLSIKYEK
jgi:hypothetical protein